MMGLRVRTISAIVAHSYMLGVHAMATRTCDVCEHSLGQNIIVYIHYVMLHAVEYLIFKLFI